jgi:hypothetical protein
MLSSLSADLKNSDQIKAIITGFPTLQSLVMPFTNILTRQKIVSLQKCFPDVQLKNYIE